MNVKKKLLTKKKLFAEFNYVQIVKEHDFCKGRMLI